MEVGLRRPKSLLIVDALLVVAEPPVGNFVVWVPILRIALNDLIIIVYLGHVPVYLINKHSVEICLYQ